MASMNCVIVPLTIILLICPKDIKESVTTKTYIEKMMVNKLNSEWWSSPSQPLITVYCRVAEDDLVLFLTNGREDGHEENKRYNIDKWQDEEQPF